jgi:hypothetical protein
VWQRAHQSVTRTHFGVTRAVARAAAGCCHNTGRAIVVPPSCWCMQSKHALWLKRAVHCKQQTEVCQSVRDCGARQLCVRYSVGAPPAPWCSAAAAGHSSSSDCGIWRCNISVLHSLRLVHVVCMRPMQHAMRIQLCLSTRCLNPWAHVGFVLSCAGYGLPVWVPRVPGMLRSR